MRYIYDSLCDFVSSKYVLLTGPRQVGKTTLAKAWLGSDGRYLSYDTARDRAYFFKKLIHEAVPEGRYVLDELHKYRRWKNWLKGVFDTQGLKLKILVTGSARLDVFRKGADSMFGRYELLRLHPLSVGELTHGKLRAPPMSTEAWYQLSEGVEYGIWSRLEQRSGFPEPYHAEDPRQYRRWIQRRRELILQHDLRDISDIREISGIEHLSLLLPERVGSPLSINSLREALSVAHDTASNWVEYLDRLYYSFRIRPYTGTLARSLRREEKLYLWNWAEVDDPGARFENMVASHLLKATHAWNDLGYGEYELMYWRDKERREVDFVLTERRKPVLLLECKRSERNLSPGIIYLGERLKVPQIQLLSDEGIDERRGAVRVVSAATFLGALV